MDADGARIVATKAELTTDAILGALQQFDGEPANLKIGSWPTWLGSDAPTLDTVAPLSEGDGQGWRRRM